MTSGKRDRQPLTEQQRREVRLRGLFELSPVGIALTDLESGLFIDVNDALLKFTGYTREEFLQLTYWDITPKEYVNKGGDQVSRMHDSGRYGPYEKEYIRKDGRRLPVRLHGMLVTEPDGRQVVWSIIEDISETRSTLDALREERDFVTQLLDIAPLIVTVLDANGKLVRANPYFYKLTGYSPDEALGRDWFSTFGQEHSQDSPEKLFRKASASAVWRKTCTLYLRSGNTRSIEWHTAALHDGESNLTGILSIGSDVTDHVQFQKQLEQFNETLEQQVKERTRDLELQMLQNKTILETAIDGFLIADTQGHILQANPALCQMVGYSSEELFGKSVFAFETGPYVEEIPERVQKIRETGHGRFDTALKTRTGEIIDVDVTAAIVTSGQYELLYSFVRDITPRKQAEIELRSARDTAREANAAKSIFLSRMSHELRTPLTAILGFSKLMTMPGQAPLSHQQVDNLTEIRRAGEHLLEMINDILDVSRIEAGHLEVRSESLALPPIMQSCIKQISVQAAARGITLETNIQPVNVLGDTTRVRQVLLNLLSNAVKYNAEGGTIVVSCLADCGQNARIAVRDTGPGIPAKEQERLFVPFERGESSARATDGAGIGLALSKQLVERMGGTIGFHSEAGKGSTFWFDLPMAETPSPEQADERISG